MHKAVSELPITVMLAMILATNTVKQPIRLERAESRARLTP